MKTQELKQIIREEIIKELFDTKETIKWKAGEDTEFTATFTGPNNQKYVIDITSLEYLNLPDSAITAARKLLPDEVNAVFLDGFLGMPGAGYYVEFRNREKGKGITGLGGSDTAKIFDIVINALISKLKKEKTELVFFSAKEPSIKELYKKMAPLIATKLGMAQVNNGKYYFLYKD